MNKFVCIAKAMARKARGVGLALTVGALTMGTALADTAAVLPDPTTVTAWDITDIRTLIAPFAVAVMAALAVVLAIQFLPRLAIWGYKIIASLFRGR